VERPAVHVDPDLLKTAPGEIGVGLDPEVGRIGVGADHTKPPGGGGLGAGDEGDQGGSAADDVAAVAGGEGPGVALGERLEAGGGEPLGGLAGGVEGRRRAVDEGAEVARGGLALLAEAGHLVARAGEAVAQLGDGLVGVGHGRRA
jgi:hypothetical protein